MPSSPSGTRRSLPLFESREDARKLAWVQLVRTFSLVQRRVVCELMRHDVTLPQFDVLANLRFGDRITQQELAERLLVTKGNVCGVLDRMEALGWVQRRADEQDRRANRLHLTVAGRRKIDAVLPAHDVVVIDALRTLSHSDVKTLRELLEKLERAQDGAV